MGLEFSHKIVEGICYGTQANSLYFARSVNSLDNSVGVRAMLCKDLRYSYCRQMCLIIQPLGRRRRNLNEWDV